MYVITRSYLATLHACRYNCAKLLTNQLLTDGYRAVHAKIVGTLYYYVSCSDNLLTTTKGEVGIRAC